MRPQHKERVSPKRTKEAIRQLTAEDILSVSSPVTNGDVRLAVKQLVVEGLLSFNDKVAFRFGRLNILVGPNGSGKSNLIDCIRIFRYAPYDIQETFKDSGF